MPVNYYQGKDCKRGHGGLRVVGSGHCVECRKLAMDRWRASNADAERERTKYNPENRKARVAAVRKWQEKNKDRVEDYNREWVASNPDKIRYYNATKKAKRKRRVVPLTDEHKKELQRIYAECPDGHEVDHIVPLLGKLVSGLHVPWNLQYLTAKENNIKRNNFEVEDGES